MEFLKELGINIASIFVIIYALSKWLGNIWETRIKTAQELANKLELMQQQSLIDTEIRQHQSELEERIKKIEQDYDLLKIQNEHFHQISQQTYQKLFEDKIMAYNEILLLSFELEREISNYKIISSIVKKKEDNQSDIIELINYSIKVYFVFDKLTAKIMEKFMLLSSELQDLRQEISDLENKIVENIGNLENNDLENTLKFFQLFHIDANIQKNEWVKYVSFNMIKNNLSMLDKIINQIRVDAKIITQKIKIMQ